MSRTIQWGVALQRKLDQQLQQQATSGWMEENAGGVQYEGGKEIKIPSMKLDGLGDYGRNTTGYPAGEIGISYQSFTMRMDRGREFNFDRNDVDESNYLLSAEQVMQEFQKRHVIPEVDAYRYSLLAQAAIAADNSATYKPAKTSILSQLKADICEMQDRTGAEDIVITMSQRVLGILGMSTECRAGLPVVDFVRGGLLTRVQSVDMMPIIGVSSARMKTSYTFMDGIMAGQTAGGFAAKSDADDINWIICPRSVPLAISKTDTVKIFSPDENQDMDSWKTQYRKYHDIWVPDGAAEGIFVSLLDKG